MRHDTKILGTVALLGLAASALVWPASGCANSAKDCASLGLPDGCSTGNGGATTTTSTSSTDTGGTGGTGGTGTGGTGGTGTGGTGTGGTGTGGTGTGGTGTGGGGPSVCAERRAGDGSDQAALGFSTSAGDVLVGGVFQGTLSFGGAQLSSGTQSGYVARLRASDLGPIWSKALPNGHLASALDAAGDALVVGTYSGAVAMGGACGSLDVNDDLYVAKLDKATGDCVWATTFKAPLSRAHVAAAMNGDIVIAGDLPSATAVDFGDGLLPKFGLADIVLVRLDTAGKLLWSRSFGSAADDTVAGMHVEPSTGDVTIAGDFQGYLDFSLGGNPLDSGGTRDAFAARIDSAGSSTWAVAFHGPASDVATGLAGVSGGDVFVSGSYDTSLTVGAKTINTAAASASFVARLGASNGAPVWLQSLDTLASGAVAAIAAGPTRVALTGSVSIDASTSRVFLSALQQGDGSLAYQSSFGGTGMARGVGVGFDGEAMVAAGSFDGQLVLDPASPLIAQGQRDVFLVRVCP
jgi:hypothetical protein